MAKFDIKTVKPKFVVTTSPENKIDVVVNKPIITSKISKSFFKLKNTGGPAGQPGRDGQDGQSATIEVASTTTLPAGSSATVENVGTDSAARLAFGIPKGDTGAAGVDGDAATIQVGQVETLEPNQQAYVTNVGTSSEAIFNIGIPKGQKGDSGSGSGDMTASVYDPNGTVAAAGGIPDYVDSNGGKIDTIKVNGTTQTITNKTVDLSVPTKTSDIANDSGYVTSTDYATSATGGVIKTTDAFGVDMSNSGEIKGTIVSSANYPTMWNDAIVSKGTLENALSTKGYALSTDIPTVNDATLTIQHNGTNVQTFTANQATNATANIETIWADDIEATTPVPAVETAMIADGAVTSAKIADGTIATGDIADGAVTAAKLDNTDSWVLIGEVKTTQEATGTVIDIAIPAAYGKASLKLTAKFELYGNSPDNWVDIQTYTSNGVIQNCVTGIKVSENGTISANYTAGQYSSYYIINATDDSAWRCWNIKAESITSGSSDNNYRSWLATSGNGHTFNNVTSLANTSSPITNIKLITGGMMQSNAVMKVWGRID